MTTPGNRGPATDTESITNPTAPNRTRILHRYTKMMDTTKHRPNCKIIPNEPNRCQAMKYAPRTNSSKGIILAKPIRSINESPPVKMESTSTRNNSTDKARKYTEPPSVLMTQSQPRRTQQKINLRGTESTNQKLRDDKQRAPQTRLRNDQDSHHRKTTLTQPTHNSRSQDSPVKGKQKP